MRKRLLSLAVAALSMAAIAPMQAQTYDKEPATVAWNFNTTADYDKATTVTPDGGFATTAVNIGDIELKEGENIIRLTVNNNTQFASGGTTKSAAPMVDCIKIYSDATLSMKTYDNI